MTNLQLGAARQLLDHGFISLVDMMGTEESIINSARISYAAMEKTGKDSEADTKLLNYLLTHGHNTPFESAVLTFHVKAPIFVVRQWFRHRTWSYNEVSARYTELPEEFYVPSVERMQKQSTSSKQGSSEELVKDVAGHIDLMEAHMHSSFALYRELLAAGLSRELARTVLPLATYTEFRGTVNLHNLLKFLAERMESHAQYEIRVYANEIYNSLRGVFPRVMQIWKDNNPKIFNS